MPSKTSLIVEDCHDVQRACVRLLCNVGYEAVTVSRLQEARRYISAFSVDLILLDINLPDGEGLHLLHALQERNAPTRVIVISAEYTPNTALQAGQLGALSYLVKPFDGVELLREIRKVEAMTVASWPANPRKEANDAVVAYIQTHSAFIKSRGDVAAHFKMSTKTVSRHVQDRTGQTFMDVLYSCKIDIAKELLVHTHAPINEVARRAGFTTHQHFTRVFKEREKCCPQSYRRQHNMP